MKVLSIVALLTTIAATSMFGADSGFNVLGQLGGPVAFVAIHSSTLLVGSGFRVVIYDVTNANAPVQVGATAPYSDLITGIAVMDHHAYITAGRAGLRIVDIENPAKPVDDGSWDSPGYAEGIDVVSDRAFVADGPFGLEILDVSDPSSPRLLSSCYDTSYACDVRVADGKAWIAAGGSGLLAADVTDPLHPREMAAFGTSGFSRRVALDDTSAYVADQWGGVRVVGIKGSQSPVEIAAMTLPSWAFGVAVSNGVLAVADGSQGLRLYDVRDPRQPQFLGAAESTRQHAGAVALDGSRAFVALRTNGVEVIDIRDPRSPTLLSKPALLADATAVIAANGVAWVGTAEQGLRVVDVQSSPRELSSIPFDGYINSLVWLADGTIVVGCSGINSATIGFVDPADPRAPKLLGKITGIYPSGLAAIGSTVAVGTELGLYLLDASQPAAPSTLSFLDFVHGDPLAELGGRVAFGDARRLYATQGNSGVRILDVSDRRNPNIVGTYRPEGMGIAQAVEAKGSTLFVVTCPPALWVADATDPANPRTLAKVPLAQCAERVTLDGSTMLIAGGAGGVMTVDVTDPSTPKVRSAAELPGHAFDVSFDGSRVVVAAGEGGVFVLSPSTTAASVAELSKFPDDADVPEHASMRGLIALQRLAPAAMFIAPAAVSRERTARIVRSIADSGEGSLREALETLANGETITFDSMVFPPTAPATIRLATPLPCVCRNNVTIDASNAGVILDGLATPRGSMGLSLGGNDGHVMGLQIVNFPHSGIFVQGSGNVIGGDRSRGTGPNGEGNVISGNFSAGVNFAAASAAENRVLGNRIGCDITGTSVLGNQTIGVFLFPGGPGIEIGGTRSADANVISGNTLAEVFLQQASGATIVGNRLGTDPSGSRKVGNAAMGIGTGGHTTDNAIVGNIIAARQQGIIISDTGTAYNRIEGNLIGVSPAGEPLITTAVSNAVGVALNESYTHVAGNTIAGIPGWCVQLGRWGTHDNVIRGNTIGARAAAQGGGIRLTASSHVFIGGARPGESNTIALNNRDGIRLDGPGSSSNFVIGNYVGGDDVGSAGGNSGFGISVSSSDGNIVQANVIRDNRAGGVLVTGAREIRIRRNRIFSNGGVGISEVSSNVPTAPVIETADRTHVDGTACASCVVEVFTDSGSQGQFYEGSTTAGADGRFALQMVARGATVTATASNAGGTSIFSAAVVLPPRPPRQRALRR